ncbi:MAG: hypothetical protein CME88_02565 [Hirschia sp.]|nr:hypothetical protein [Hirschia sp.]MBF17246.1 hypothetical protein [Hirschia sp.]
MCGRVAYPLSVILDAECLRISLRTRRQRGGWEIGGWILRLALRIEDDVDGVVGEFTLLRFPNESWGPVKHEGRVKPVIFFGLDPKSSLGMRVVGFGNSV